MINIMTCIVLTLLLPTNIRTYVAYLEYIMPAM